MAWMEQREQEIKTIRMDWSDHGGENVLSTENHIQRFEHYLLKNGKALKGFKHGRVGLGWKVTYCVLCKYHWLIHENLLKGICEEADGDAS